MMSSQTKVQGYLNKHKISTLFEHMMSSLVREMPADPYDHLIALIQENKLKHHRTSAAEEGVSKTTTSVWASTDLDYDKPWRNNSKLVAKTKKVEAPHTFSRKEWDKTVKLTHKTFDELGTVKQEKIIEKRTLKHADPDVGDVFTIQSNSYDNPTMTEEELLKNEIFSSSKQAVQAIETKETSAVRCHPKKKGPKAEAVKHQKQLAEFIEEKKAADADSGISDDSSERDSSSPTVYVAENLEDLADEGVNIKSMNAIKSKTVIRQPILPTEPVINVSICARCAKVLHANDRESNDGASQISFGSTSTQKSASTKHSKSTTKSTQKSKVSDVWKTHRTDPLNVPVQNPQLVNNGRAAKPLAAAAVTPLPTGREYLPTGRTGFSSYYATADDDDEFDSVSQISGERARMPVWGADVNDEDISPVKGTSMLMSPRTPVLTKQTAADSSKQRLAVTLKEDLLRQLPQKSDTVEDFLAVAGRTWSGEKLAETRSKDKVRRSYEPAAGFVHSANRKSYDFISGVDRNTGWKIDYNSDGESTLVP